MYAGELEKHLSEQHYQIEGYDDFLGMFKGKNNKTKTDKTKEDRSLKRERRNTSFQKLEDKVKSYGGIEGIGQSISNVAGLFKAGNNPSTSPASSYAVNFGNDPAGPKESSNKQIYILGAVLVGVGLVWALARFNSTKSQPLNLDFS